MGLNIGIEVADQYGHGPDGTIEDLEERFFGFLHEKFPQGGFGHGWVRKSKGRMTPLDAVYDFDVRVFRYGAGCEQHGYSTDAVYLAIAEFIFKEFSHLEGIKMETYYSG